MTQRLFPLINCCTHLISTRALSPTAVAILLARVLNADHCLQASTETNRFPLVVVAAALLTFSGFLEPFFDGALALAEAAFLAGGGSFEVSDSAFFANRLDVRGTIFLAADDVAQICMPLLEESMAYGRSTLAMGFVLCGKKDAPPSLMQSTTASAVFFTILCSQRITCESKAHEFLV